MSYSGSGNASGWNQGGGPDYRHAFDPYLEPELFRSVLTRRVIAFIVDLFILAVPIALAVIFIAVFGLVTVFASRLDEASLAAHSIAVNVIATTYMVPLGISSASRCSSSRRRNPSLKSSRPRAGGCVAR